MLDYVRLEVRRTLRDRGFVIFGIGMPVLMYVLMSAFHLAAWLRLISRRTSV